MIKFVISLILSTLLLKLLILLTTSLNFVDTSSIDFISACTYCSLLLTKVSLVFELVSITLIAETISSRSFEKSDNIPLIFIISSLCPVVPFATS
ncbi:hypothetical protein D3C76_1447600 [compost metagenome]